MSDTLPVDLQRATNDLLSHIEAITKIIGEYIRDNSDTKLEKVLRKYLEDGGIPAFIHTPYYYKELCDELTKRNIPHLESSPKENDGRIVFARAKDLELVKVIYEEILKEKSFSKEISKREMMDMKYGETLHAIKGIDDVELQVLRRKAEQMYITISTEKTLDGKYIVYYDSEKAPEMMKAVMNMTWDLTGTFGQKQRAQMQYDIENRQNIFESVQMGAKDFYVTSGRNINETIQINKDGYIFMKDNLILERGSRNEPEFQKNLWKLIEQINEPILLNEAEHSLSEKEREKIINTRRRYRPFITKEEYELRNKELEIIALLERKLALDSPEQTEVSIDFYNHQISFAQHEALEVINKENNIEKTEEVKEHIEEYVEELNSYEFVSFKVRERSLEKEIYSASEAKSREDIQIER